jgi:hypothetical protein
MVLGHTEHARWLRTIEGGCRHGGAISTDLDVALLVGGLFGGLPRSGAASAAESTSNTAQLSECPALARRIAGFWSREFGAIVAVIGTKNLLASM